MRSHERVVLKEEKKSKEKKKNESLSFERESSYLSEDLAAMKDKCTL